MTFVGLATAKVNDRLTLTQLIELKTMVDKLLINSRNFLIVKVLIYLFLFHQKL